MDKSFIESNNLENYEGKSILSVEILYEYKDFLDIKDLDLENKTFSI